MGRRTIAVLGTARNDFVLAAAVALRDAGASVTVLVRRGREAGLVGDGLPVRTFSGRIAWYSLPLLAALRDVDAKSIAVVVGDQFAHANVTTALNWWRAAGLLRADIYLSSSTQPAVLECFNSIDQRQWLGAAVAVVLAVALLVRYPIAALVAAAAISGLELVALRARGWTADACPACPEPVWPILVDDPRLGWRLRPVSIAAIASTPGIAHRTIRVTVDADGQRSTGHPWRAPDSRPAIAFYGGSYVFGDSLSDEETIPWQAAGLLTEYRVFNRAVQGYGAVQALTRLLDDMAGAPPAAVLVILDGDERAVAGNDSTCALRFPNPGHARFPPSDRFATWPLIRRVLNRSREHRTRERTLRTVSERCAREGIPIVVAVTGVDRAGLGAVLSRCRVHSTTIADGASCESVAALLAQKVREALDDRQRR